jgi:hypothetical protein
MKSKVWFVIVAKKVGSYRWFIAKDGTTGKTVEAQMSLDSLFDHLLRSDIVNKKLDNI